MAATGNTPSSTPDGWKTVSTRSWIGPATIERVCSVRNDRKFETRNRSSIKSLRAYYIGIKRTITTCLARKVVGHVFLPLGGVERSRRARCIAVRRDDRAAGRGSEGFASILWDVSKRRNIVRYSDRLFTCWRHLSRYHNPRR